MLKPLAMVFVCAASTSYADQPAVPAPTKLTMEPAKVLVRALKLSGLKSKKAKSKTTWTAKMLACTTKQAKDHVELDVTECDADGKKVTGAAAIVLETAMNTAKIPAPYMMGKTQIRASELTCVLDVDARNEDGPFVCTYTPVGR